MHRTLRWLLCLCARRPYNSRRLELIYFSNLSSTPHFIYRLLRQRYCFSEVFSPTNYEPALPETYTLGSLAAQRDGLLLVCGSLYFVFTIGGGGGVKSWPSFESKLKTMMETSDPNLNVI